MFPPKAFSHLAGGDGQLKTGINVDGGPNPPEGGSGVLGEDVIGPMTLLGGNQQLLEHLPALWVKYGLEEQEMIEGKTPEFSLVYRGLRLCGGAVLWVLRLGQTSLTLPLCFRST